MKFYTFEVNRQRRIGVEWEGQLVDLAFAYDAALAPQHVKEPRLRALPRDMHSFIALGPAGVEAVKDTLAFVQKRPAVPVGEQLAYPFETVNLLAPIERPGKILCCATNDRGETIQKNEVAATFSVKLPSSVIGPGQAIVKPSAVNQLGYAVHLAVVIGRRMKNITPAEVLPSIFGYTILNDICARDALFNENQNALGKNFNTFCPLGPCVVSPDELTTHDDLPLRIFLSGVLVQTIPLRESFSSLPRLVSGLSQVITLEPGDIVSAGIPANGPGAFLIPGDTLLVEISGIGQLENPVIALEVA